jgi:hypothetical protein
MYPSIKTLLTIPGLTRERAALIRAIMRGTAPKVCKGCKGDMASAETGSGVTPTGDSRYCSAFYDGRCRYSKLVQIDAALGTFGVEYIHAGGGAKSPAIYYCNTGDTYGTTILKVNGRYRVGCWGDIVERGNYE